MSEDMFHTVQFSFLKKNCLSCKVNSENSIQITNVKTMRCFIRKVTHFYFLSEES